MCKYINMCVCIYCVCGYMTLKYFPQLFREGDDIKKKLTDVSQISDLYSCQSFNSIPAMQEEAFTCLKEN